VLKFYKRDGIVDLIIFEDTRPIVYSKAGVMIAISTEVLKIVGPDDAALAGIIAHESAHEYVAMQMLSAVQARDLERFRELELFCDAVAVVVLLDLGLDPSRYAQVVSRIANYSTAAVILNDGSNSHPAVDARLRLILDITTSLKGNPSDTLKKRIRSPTVREGKLMNRALPHGRASDTRL
jgi:predicted Zn-dependent protease